MRQHINAIINQISELGDVYYRDAVRYDAAGNQIDLEYPYWIVWPSDARPGQEDNLASVNADISATVAVTSVASTPEGAQIAADRARNLLGMTTWQPLEIAGHRAQIRWQSQVGGAIDRDVKMPRTNRHPAYEVDFYHLKSTPE